MIPNLARMPSASDDGTLTKLDFKQDADSDGALLAALWLTYDVEIDEDEEALDEMIPGSSQAVRYGIGKGGRPTIKDASNYPDPRIELYDLEDDTELTKGQGEIMESSLDVRGPVASFTIKLRLGGDAGDFGCLLSYLGAKVRLVMTAYQQTLPFQTIADAAPQVGARSYELGQIVSGTTSDGAHLTGAIVEIYEGSGDLVVRDLDGTEGDMPQAAVQAPVLVNEHPGSVNAFAAGCAAVMEAPTWTYLLAGLGELYAGNPDAHGPQDDGSYTLDRLAVEAGLRSLCGDEARYQLPDDLQELKPKALKDLWRRLTGTEPQELKRGFTREHLREMIEDRSCWQRAIDRALEAARAHMEGDGDDLPAEA